MQSTVHSQVIVAENHRAKVKNGQAELGCIARSVFPLESDCKNGEPSDTPLSSGRVTRGLYRRCSGEKGVLRDECWSGALSIKRFVVSRWLSAAGRGPMGIE